MDKEVSTYKLPEGWSLAIINEVISGDGLFKDGDWIESKDQNPRGDVRLIQLADIGDGFFRSKSNRFMTSEKAYELNCTLLQFGDILLARMPEPLGRCCIFPINDNQKYVTIVDIAIIRCGHKGVYNKYLNYILNSLSIRNQIETFQTGTTRKRISRSNLGKILIPIPPLNEQFRIVSKIEELFSELEHAGIGLRKSQKQLEVYKQALLKNAFEGKLTKKWREKKEIELAENLLYRISHERKNRYNTLLADWNKEVHIWKKNGKKDKKPIPPAKFRNVESFTQTELQKLTSLPNNWKWAKVESIADISMGQSPPGESYNTIGKGIPLINGPAEFGSTPFSKTLLKKWTMSPTKMSKEGDLILCVRGSTTGRQNIAGFDACIGRGVASVRAIFLSQRYIAYYFHFSEREVFKMGTGTTFPNISNEQICSFPIPICGIDEQEQIVQELESNFTLIENLKNSINIALQKIEVFRSIILKKAFDGKLVPQDSNDESATQLLKQIQKEKAIYLNSQKEIAMLKPKYNKTMENNKKILELLKDKGEPISAKELWQLSIYKDNIDAFYAQLKEHIEKGEIEEIERRGKESYLKLTDSI